MFGPAKCRPVKFGHVQFGQVKFGFVKFGPVKFGHLRKIWDCKMRLVKFGFLFLGLMKFGLVRFEFGLVKFGLVEFAARKIRASKFRARKLWTCKVWTRKLWSCTIRCRKVWRLQVWNSFDPSVASQHSKTTPCPHDIPYRISFTTQPHALLCCTLSGRRYSLPSVFDIRKSLPLPLPLPLSPRRPLPLRLRLPLPPPLCIYIICESGIGLPGRDPGGRPVTSDLPRTCGGDVLQYAYIPPRLPQIPTEASGDCGGLRRGQRDRRNMPKRRHDVEHQQPNTRYKPVFLFLTVTPVTGRGGGGRRGGVIPPNRVLISIVNLRLLSHDILTLSTIILV